MRATEAFKLNNVAAATYPIKPDGAGDAYLFGGRYEYTYRGTGSGTVDLQQLSPDGSTWEPVITQITAATYARNTVDIPPGRYRVVISGFTANFFTLTRVPVSE